MLEKYIKLSSKNRETILKFSDDSPNYTLSKFFDEADDATLDALNKHENSTEALLGHKSEYTRADYENIAEVLDDVEDVTPTAKQFMDNWLERSAGLSNFIGTARIGNRLGANIIKSIRESTLIKNLLETKLGTSLDGYTVLTEIPFKVPISSSTPGGFMKADIVLAKFKSNGEIESIFVIENKLRGSTKFTPAQTSKFIDVKNAPDGSKVTFEVKFDRGQLEAGDLIQVPKENVLRIKDSGTDDVNSITIDDIQFVKDLDF